MSKRLHVMAPFLVNLREMVDDETNHYLIWTCDGQAFEIRNRDAMIELLLPKYFNHNRYKSFQRQLNYFHFKKWPKAKTNVCTFSNPYFTRDKPQNMKFIKRKRPKHTPTVQKWTELDEAQWNQDVDWLLDSMESMVEPIDIH